METLFKLQNSKDNINLLAFQYHTLDYSLGIFKNRKNELKKDPLLKHKIDNYLLMARLSISQQLHDEDLPFDITSSAMEYLENPNNADLKNYINICNHIVAKELCMVELCKKVDFGNHLFIAVGKDLICTDCDLSTVSTDYTDIEKAFLYSCAKRAKRIIRNDGVGKNIVSMYNDDTKRNNLVVTP